MRHLQLRVGLGAHEEALMRQLGNRIRARYGAKEGLALPAERRHGRGHRGRPGAENRRDLVDVDQFAGGPDACFGAGLVVLADQSNTAAKHAAGFVDLLDHAARDLGHHWAIGAAGPGERRQGGELDGVGLRTHHCGACEDGDAAREGCSATDEKAVHGLPPVSCCVVPEDRPATCPALPPRKRSRTVGSAASSAARPSRSGRPCTST